MKGSASVQCKGMVLHIVVAFVSLCMIGPFIWMIICSFKTGTEIMRLPPTFFPQNPTVQNYVYIWTNLPFARYFINSVIVSSASTAVVLFTSSLAGFVFAKFEFFWKEKIFISILSSMMIPFAVVMLPLFVLVTKLNWIDTYQGLIVPTFISAFGIFLMRQFIDGIPDALIDAARIDGASNWWIYTQVILPLSTSALAALTIFHFMWTWNTILWPLIVTQTYQMRVLSLGIAQLSQELYATRYDLVITGAAIASIPIVIIYFFAQRHFVRGLALTGLKY